MNARRILATPESATRVLLALTTEEIECVRDALIHREQSWCGPDEYRQAVLAVQERIERQINPAS